MSAQMMNDNLSLYIPHVFPNFTSEYITGVFEFMEYGKVERVDLVSKVDKNGCPYNSAYIHFSKWFTGPVAENFKARVLDPEREARIIHDDPWYWIVLENKTKKYIPGARKECSDLSEQKLAIPCGIQGPFVPTSNPGVVQLILTDEDKVEMQQIIDEQYEIAQLKSDLKRLKNENEGLLKENDWLHSTLDSQNAQLLDAEHHIIYAAKYNEKMENLNLVNLELERQIDRQNQDLIEMTMQLEEMQKRLAYATVCLDETEDELMDLVFQKENAGK